MVNRKHVEELINFQTAFGGLVNKTFTKLPIEDINLRINMYDEEAEEFLKFYRLGNNVEILDAICDELFLTLGDAVCFGVQDKINLNPIRSVIDSPKLCTLTSLEFSDLLRKNNENSVIDSIDNRIKYILSKAFEIYGSYAVDIVTEALTTVWESNMSKLGDDGKPLINGENGVSDDSKPKGKILKSKNYWTPTEKLIAILKSYGKDV